MYERSRGGNVKAECIAHARDLSAMRYPVMDTPCSLDRHNRLGIDPDTGHVP
ncbi:MAG TPA: hypothetical protein VM115_09790 [Vicinamibacterales bacterium]|nr:hypothetical protein [Vicinamibacterales bacterium]